MSNKQVPNFVLFIITVFMSGCSQPESFQNAVLPILQESCVVCHSDKGEGLQKSGLILNSYDSVMKGTKYGQVVVPGSAVSSTLYLVIDHNVDPKIQMPPHHNDKYPTGEGDPLTPKQIEIIKNWIDQGAKNN
jgi:hypothetical protein